MFQRVYELKRGLLLAAIVLMTVPTTPVLALEGMSQLERVQAIVSEQLLQEDGEKLDELNPVFEEVLRIRGRRTGESLTGYLKTVVVDLMPPLFKSSYKDVSLYVRDKTLIVRMTNFTGNMGELDEWMARASEVVMGIIEKDTIEVVNMQVWMSKDSVMSNLYTRE